MTTVTTREFKNRLSEYLHRASAGEGIVVTSRGKPIASISRPPERELTTEQKLKQMERQAILTMSTQKFVPPKKRLELRGEGPSVSEMVLADRGEPIP